MTDTDNDSVDGDDSVASLFPEEPRPPTPPPTISTYVRTRTVSRVRNDRDLAPDGSEDVQWNELRIRLVGSHPLWGHHLWNAARSFASYLDEHPELYLGRNVLELGAGGGLPGLVTVLNGSRKTVLTDYPDKDLLENLEANVDGNVPVSHRQNVHVQGYTWGTNVDPLLDIVRSTSMAKYDLIILSDLLFNHSQHDALLKTCELVLSDHQAQATDESKPRPTVLVFYTHHRVQLADKDLAFFDKARASGWTCTEFLTEKHSPMFANDVHFGPEEVRATVHGWSMYRTV